MNNNFTQNQSKPSLFKSARKRIDERKDAARKGKFITFNSFAADFKRNPMIFIGLGGSAVLTALMGLFIGFAPHYDDAGVLYFFSSDTIFAAVIGSAFGVIYAIAFPTIGEFGTYFWHKKASMRDPENTTQAIIAYTMFGITLVFTLLTSISASFILASLLRSFTQFTSIPVDAQYWTVLIIPISLIVHATANIWYDHVSKAAEERREMERDLQSTEIEAEERIRQARIDAQKRVAISHAEEYERVSSVEADEAGKRLARDTWEKDRITFGADKRIEPHPFDRNEPIPEIEERNNHRTESENPIKR